MRLDDFDPNINVEDQRGQSFGGGFGGLGGGGGGGGLFFLLPLVFSRFGCAGVAVLLLVMAVLGGGPRLLSGGGDAPTQQSAPAAAGGAAKACTVDTASKEACDAFSSADKTWAAIFQQQGRSFQAPGLVFYAREGQSGCGEAQSAMGPFYCPSDGKVYLDPAFFQELTARFGANGDFARDYVIAHEFGHHIQNLLGTSDKVSREERASGGGSGAEGPSVRLELQADCYAGVWAAANRDRLDPGDVQEGMTAAHAIGDDTLEQQAQGRVVPDSFTHGTSAQRMTWLKKGMDTGDPAACDTFSGSI